MASTIRGSDNFDSGTVGSTTYGDVGTYGFFLWNGATQNLPGATVSGNNLYPANTYDYNGSAGWKNSNQPSGTWRLMGETGYYNGGTALTRTDMSVTVFVRIS
jgi:hypothetical protein